jgi:pyrroline-5-carboxylate reductase
MSTTTTSPGALQGKAIGILGLGRMGEALAACLARLDPPPAALLGYTRRAERLDDVVARCAVSPRPSAEALLADADVVVLAVKPGQMTGLLDEISPVATADTLFVSVAAGVTLATLQAGLGAGVPVIRAMSNTPLTVRQGATVLCPGDALRPGDLATAVALFRAGGSADVVKDEALLDVVTGLVGSGPAFLFLAIEALADGAVQQGLPRDLADRLARQVVHGAGALAASAGREHVAVLKDAVTSPGGTTAAGLRVLEDRAFRGALMAAVAAAAERSRELGGGS